MTENEGSVDPDAADNLSYASIQNPHDILWDITVKTHEHVKSETTHLTELKGTFADEDRPVCRTSDASAGVPMDSRRLIYRERLYPASMHDQRGAPPYAKDYARIIHSPSFRRLQGKTQLIPAGENEFFRTRLTHSLEVAEIATRIARKLNTDFAYFTRYPINLELVSCAALLHDIGHPPFGHSGEEVLNEKMADFGGFEGNAQTLRIVTNLENRLGRGISIQQGTDNPIGLNLTVGVLASVLKYDWVSPGARDSEGKVRVNKGYYPAEEPVVRCLREKLEIVKGERLHTIECQIMDIADDIAYSAYDLEDTLEAGIITPFDLMSIDDDTLYMVERDMKGQFLKRREDITFTVPDILENLNRVFGQLMRFANPSDYNMDSNRRDRHVFVARTFLESIQHQKNPLVRRQYLETMIERNIEALYLEFDRDRPFLSVLRIDDGALIAMEALKAFNFHKVISSRRLQVRHHRNKKIIAGIFDALARDGGKLLSDFQRKKLQSCKDERVRMRLISDIISSFTDGEATSLYDQLNSSRTTFFAGYSRQ